MSNTIETAKFLKTFITNFFSPFKKLISMN